MTGVRLTPTVIPLRKLDAADLTPAKPAIPVPAAVSGLTADRLAEIIRQFDADFPEYSGILQAVVERVPLE